MKRLFAVLLCLAMLLSLTACGGSPKANLETFEMTCEPDGVEEPARVTLGYPKGFAMEKQDWCVTLTDEAKDVQIEVYFTNDYNCYAVNQEYAKEEYFFYEEGTFGDFTGYAYRMDEASAEVEVQVYLGCVAEMDDVYLTFRIGSASRSLDADPMALYKLDEVKQVLSSAVYAAPAEPAE